MLLAVLSCAAAPCAPAAPRAAGGAYAAALRFASVYGADVVGIDPGVFEEARPLTEAELERVYRRVTKALGGRKFSACRGAR